MEVVGELYLAFVDLLGHRPEEVLHHVVLRLPVFLLDLRTLILILIVPHHSLELLEQGLGCQELLLCFL